LKYPVRFLFFFAAGSLPFVIAGPPGADVLPGELVRRCAESTAAGLLAPAGLLGMQHLIVDEYQDLNQSDIDFVEAIIASGVSTFVASDDKRGIA